MKSICYARLPICSISRTVTIFRENIGSCLTDMLFTRDGRQVPGVVVFIKSIPDLAVASTTASGEGVLPAL